MQRPKLTSDSPGYFEAFPVIEAAEALRAWRRGRHWCIWRDQHGFQVGKAAANWTSPTSLKLRYDFRGPPYLPPHSDFAELTVRYVTSGKSKRAVFVCPQCGTKAAKLVLHRTLFKCRRCSRLRNRSATLEAGQGALEKMQAIDAAIGQGRPPGMRNARYHGLIDERSRIVRHLGRKRPRLPVGKHYRITLTDWLETPDFLG
jgi:ribosomal protein L37AE/L43A